MTRQQETPDRKREDVVQLMGEINEKSQQLLRDLAGRGCANGASAPDPLNLGSTVLELTARLMTNPATCSSGRRPASSCWAAPWPP